MEMAWTSVTKWLNYLLNIGPLTAIKNCSIGKNIAKVCSRFYPKLNKTSKICERLRIFCQSGEIWANLVTLAWTKIVTVWVIEKMISLIAKLIFLNFRVVIIESSQMKISIQNISI